MGSETLKLKPVDQDTDSTVMGGKTTKGKLTGKAPQDEIPWDNGKTWVRITGPNLDGKWMDKSGGSSTYTITGSTLRMGSETLKLKPVDQDTDSTDMGGKTTKGKLTGNAPQDEIQ